MRTTGSGAGIHAIPGTSSVSRLCSSARRRAAPVSGRGRVGQSTITGGSSRAVRGTASSESFGESAGEPVLHDKRWTVRGSPAPSAESAPRSDSYWSAFAVTSALKRPYSSAGGAPNTPANAASKLRTVRAVMRRQTCGRLESLWPGRCTSHSRYAEPTRYAMLPPSHRSSPLSCAYVGSWPFRAHSRMIAARHTLCGRPRPVILPST